MNETICTLKNYYAVPIENFTSMEISNLFDLDTSKCFIGVKKPKFNIHCLYDIFGPYCQKDKWEVKELMRKEIEDNWRWFNRATSVCLSWKDTDLTAWFKKQRYKNAAPDEVSLYALSVLLCRHMVIYNSFHPWHTILYKPGLTADIMDEACKTKLLYVGDYLFGELHRKNITSLPAPIVLEDIQEARLLHCDHNIPELYLKHVRQTTFNTSNVNIVDNLQTFVSPLDTTVILGTSTTVFDPDFVPENDIKPDTSMVKTEPEQTMPTPIALNSPIKK